ncbi:MAG: YfhO family protein [Desulfuromonadaceae bacterium]|nr:YfhO family protein [Desulfuromonadaceae bacterium]MDD2848942.1 YfhO family protein [Desulfuromonadaceae bacterium]MDD4131690.1 YfhO family protein [Desulfuromonadaceae bacterium]
MLKKLRHLVTERGQRREAIRYAALIMLFLSPVFAYLTIASNGGNTLLFEDGMLQSFPFRVFLHNAFAGGFSPQWVPSSACGFSLLAEGQNGICFPVTQIIYRLFSAETGWLVEMISARLVAFTLCALLLRQLRVSWFASLFGASVFAFCTATFGLENVPALMWCHALLPGIFLSCLLFIDKRPFSFVYLTISLSLVFLIGHPVMMVYLAMTVLAFFLFHWLGAETVGEGARGIGLRFLMLLGSVIVAIVIASPQLLPMLEEFRFSARTVGAGVTLDALQNTLHLEPGWLPLSLFPTPAGWGEWGGMSSTIRFPLYALFLCFIGMFAAGKGPGRNYFVFLGLFSLLMALGPYVGLWKIVHSLPILKYFRFPYRWLFFLPICVAYLSARGVDQLLERDSSGTPVIMGKILTFVLPLCVIGVASVFVIHYERLLPQTRTALASSPLLTALLWLSSMAMVLAAFLSLGKGTMVRRGALAGVVASVICLFASNAFNIKSPLAVHDLGTIGWRGSPPPQEPQAYRTSSDLPPYNVWLTNSMNRHYPYTPNLTVLNGTLSTGHYFSFFPYWSANVSAWCRDALDGDQGKQVYLDLSSAKWLFLQDSSSVSRLFPAASFKGIKAHLNSKALPRASVVPSYRLFPDEGSLLAFLESPDFDPRLGMAILKSDAEEWNLQADADNSVATTPPQATITLDRPDRIEIELDAAAAQGSYLVLSDTYYPGWRASVDGVEKKILRTNYAFRGIQLPEGARHVVFFYEPLIPDAALPLPTFLLLVMGLSVYLRFRLNRRR